MTVWDREIPVKEIIRQILTEAFQRADITGDFEWRAGCPVHSGLEYRAELAEVLSGFGGVNRVSSIVEEPVLFLELALRQGSLQPGSYMIYDLGGGSFDCALAEVGEGRRMTTYAAQGNPVLGGDKIDDLLSEALNYNGDARSLRLAKEQVSPATPSQPLPGGYELTWPKFEEMLDKDLFLQKTLATMREAYISAKVIWKRAEGDSPIGKHPILSAGCHSFRVSAGLEWPYPHWRSHQITLFQRPPEGDVRR